VTDDAILEFNSLVGRQILEWGYVFNIDESGLMIYDEAGYDEGPLALLHHAGDGIIEVVFFQDSNSVIPLLPMPRKIKVFMGDPGWEDKIRELIQISKLAFREGANGHKECD
jgi:hypothetical protein